MIDQKQYKVKIKKRNTYKSAYALYEGQELILNVFRSGLFPIKETKGKGIKILTSKQMLQRLVIAPAQVQAGNTSEKLLNEIIQIIYPLYSAKEIMQQYKVCNNIMNSIKVIQKVILYLCILKIVKHLIVTDYHSILQIK